MQKVLYVYLNSWDKFDHYVVECWLVYPTKQFYKQQYQILLLKPSSLCIMISQFNKLVYTYTINFWLVNMNIYLFLYLDTWLNLFFTRKGKLI